MGSGATDDDGRGRLDGTQSNGLQARGGEQPDDLAANGVSAIEFDLRAALMKRKITPEPTRNPENVRL